MNKKGTIILKLLEWPIAVFFIAIFLGLMVFMFFTLNSAMDIDIDAGGVNFGEAKNQTFGKIAVGFIDNADILGIVTIIGMAISMILVAYVTRGGRHKLWIPLDMMIIFFAFIFAVYISNAYNSFITATSSPILDVYIDNIPNISKFVLNLPPIIGTLGAFIMIVTYAIKREEEEVNVSGF